MILKDEKPEWISRCTEEKDISVDIFFNIDKDIVDFTIPVRKSMISFSDFLKNNGELIEYYSIVWNEILDKEKIQKNKKNKKYLIRKNSHKFSLSLIFFRKKVFQWDNKSYEMENLVYFPWYDNILEFIPLIDALIENKNDLIFCDLEQGWKIEIFSYGNYFYFGIYSGFSRDESPYYFFKTDKIILRSKVILLKDRIKKVVAKIPLIFNMRKYNF